MFVHINGKEVKTSCSSLAQLIEENGLYSKSLIAELNFQIIKQKDWPATAIKDGDRVELLRFVGGG